MGSPFISITSFCAGSQTIEVPGFWLGPNSRGNHPSNQKGAQMKLKPDNSCQADLCRPPFEFLIGWHGQLDWIRYIKVAHPSGVPAVEAVVHWIIPNIDNGLKHFLWYAMGYASRATAWNGNIVCPSRPNPFAACSFWHFSVSEILPPSSLVSRMLLATKWGLEGYNGSSLGPCGIQDRSKGSSAWYNVPIWLKTHTPHVFRNQSFAIRINT